MPPQAHTTEKQPSGAPPENTSPGGESRGGMRQRLGLWAGPILFVLFLLLPAPEGLSEAGWHVAAVGLLMAVWWITEAIPIAATALVPLVAFPLLGVAPISDAAAPYANPLIFLFMGGFVIAIAMQAWGLHRRIALTIVRFVGVRPASIVIGFIITSAFLSMWVSNTATALMMLPIGLSIITLTKERLADEGRPAPANFATVLVLSIAYACNVGGLGTLIGTPPNALLAGFMAETYDFEVGFVQWMALGVPLVVVSLPLVYAVLVRVFPLELKELPGGAALIDRELAVLGPLSDAERKVALVFGGTALLWMLRPLLSALAPGLSDAGIAMAASLALFLIPTTSGDPASGDQRALLRWDDAEGLPWGVLILFGGGLSLAAAISDTGLAAWIGHGVNAFSRFPLLLVVLLVVVIIVLLTEITSNTATAAAFLPILGAVAVGIGQNPLLLVVPAAMAASCAFMLPVATPPNATVYGSGYLTIGQMSKAGLWLNLLFAVLITALAYTLLTWVFGVQAGVVPDWAGR